MVYELNHVGVFVSDANKTIDFYTRILGAQLVFDKEIPDRVHIAYLQIANGMIEIVDIKNPPEGHKCGYNHLTFMTDNIDEDYKKIIDAGYKVYELPKPAASGHGRLGFLSDPDGIRVELIERDDTFRKPVVLKGDVKSFDHICISAKDLEATLHFYQHHLPMEFLHKEYVESINLTMIQLHMGDDSIEISNVPGKASSDLIKHMAFRVDNVDETVARFQQQGVVFDAGYPKSAMTGLGRTAKFSGPDGEVIDIIDRKDFRDL